MVGVMILAALGYVAYVLGDHGLHARVRGAVRVAVPAHRALSHAGGAAAEVRLPTRESGRVHLTQAGGHDHALGPGFELLARRRVQARLHPLGQRPEAAGEHTLE